MFSCDVQRLEPAPLGPLDGPEREDMDCVGVSYLGKVARLGSERFRAMYPGYGDWYRVKRELDPDWVFSSSLSRRLFMEEGP